MWQTKMGEFNGCTKIGVASNAPKYFSFVPKRFVKLFINKTTLDNNNLIFSF